VDVLLASGDRHRLSWTASSIGAAHRRRSPMTTERNIADNAIYE
jgi:hypothetical protein